MIERALRKLPAAAGALGAASIVIGMGTYLVIGQFDRQVLILVGIGLALLLIAASYYPTELLELLGGRSARYGSNTLAMIVIFLGILALINFYSANHYYRWDLTETKSFTLSSQTISVLNNLRSTVKITAFYAGGSFPQLEDLLKEYKRVSDKIEYQFIDPDRMPAIARQYQIQRYGTTVIEYNGKRQDISGFGEQDITSAILKLSQDKQKKVYFLTGHGEIAIDSFDGTGGDEAKSALRADNYDVATLTLAATGSVPDDAAVIVIAGAKTPFLDDEKQAINDYLEKGGKAMILVDPQGSPTVNEILKAWGVDVGSGVVIDPASSLANQPQVPVVAQYQYSQITKDMAQMMLLPLATSVTPQNEMPKGVSAMPLFKSTDRSWLETDQRIIKFDEDKDIRGPLTMGLTVEGSKSAVQPEAKEGGDDQKTPKTRLVVVGNSTFATNDLLRNPALGNKDLFVNAVNWLAEDEGLISIRAKMPSQKQIFLTGTEESFVFYSSAVFLPLAVIIVGAIVWWRRR